MKHKLFLFIFGAFSIVKWLMSIYFQNCFVMRHVWIIYLLYFVLITAVFLTRIPTVTVKQQVRIVECVMLGNGQVTNEIFNNTRYRG